MKNQAMTKSLEVISEAIRNPKHPFRKVDNQPKKPLKHRYERRKIREYLHLGELGERGGDLTIYAHFQLKPKKPRVCVAFSLTKTGAAATSSAASGGRA